MPCAFLRDSCLRQACEAWPGFRLCPWGYLRRNRLLARIIDPADRVAVFGHAHFAKVFGVPQVSEDMAKVDGGRQIDDRFKPIVPDDLERAVNYRLATRNPGQ